MKSALFRTLLLSPLAIGVAFARETPKVSMTLPDKPREVLTMYADEPVMHRAIRRARDELADFLELAASPKRHLENFAVRVALLEHNEIEYIWVGGFKEDDNSRFAGVVAGDIHMQSRFKRGDPFTFVRGDIVDWTYTDTRTGRVYGAYTDCALLTLAPADVAARIRKERKLDCNL
jgi:uncharacterized protein YegJ (DUF2314 family)